MTLNRHQFEQAAKHFRAGRLTLSDFANQLFPKPDETEKNASSNPKSNADAATVKLPQRKRDAHKGDFGRVLVIGGSRTMPGAIGLTALAALRAGSGLVVVATPHDATSVVAGYSPCYVTEGYDSCEALAQLQDRLEWADVIAIGPGMGQDPAKISFVTQLYKTAPQPIVIDADAINSVSYTHLTLPTIYSV